MPNYGIPQVGGVLASVLPGDTYTLFNAETPTAPQSSVAFARGYTPGTGASAPILFTVSFANASPTAQVDIMASNVDADSQYQVVNSVVNSQLGFYQDAGNFAYYRARLTSGSGGALTVIAKG
jgi:hypothetical protein